MKDYKSLSHTKWDCKYHIVWIPKYRKKLIYGHLRKYLGSVLKSLVNQKESEILEGHLRGDHVHILISMPPKYSVAQVVGFIKDKSAIYIAWNFAGEDRNFKGQSFWERGYFATTVGADEEVVRTYIKEQEKEDKRFEQLTLF